MDLNLITLGTALVAGVLSFVSPCCLPLVPAYLSYITGVSVEEFSSAQAQGKQTEIVTSAFTFALGLALVFTLLGATATAIGQLLREPIVLQIAGIIVIIFGLQMLGVLRLPFLNIEKRLNFTKRLAPGAVGALFMGMAFGIGWTPCVGPFLGSILLLASQTATVSAGMALLFAYGLGLGVPFIIAGLLIGQLFPLLKNLKRYTRTFTYASGGLLIVMGILLFTDRLSWITSALTRLMGNGLAQ
jgi:cytochrome c-type biogenesis protein